MRYSDILPLGADWRKRQNQPKVGLFAALRTAGHTLFTSSVSRSLVKGSKIQKGRQLVRKYDKAPLYTVWIVKSYSAEHLPAMLPPVDSTWSPASEGKECGWTRQSTHAVLGSLTLSVFLCLHTLFSTDVLPVLRLPSLLEVWKAFIYSVALQVRLARI